MTLSDIWKLAFILALLAASAYLKCSNYSECRTQFSVGYCLTSGSK